MALPLPADARLVLLEFAGMIPRPDRFLGYALALVVMILLPGATSSSSPQFITSWGGFGTGDSQFQTPIGVAVGPDGSVYTIDSNNHRVQRFTSSGSYLSQWGPLNAQGIAVDAAGFVYTTERDEINAALYHDYIKKFTSTGALVAQWGGPEGSGPGQLAGPNGICIDSNGHVFVADEGNYRICEFSNTGTLLNAWGTQGTGMGQFESAEAVAAGPNGDIFVVDRTNIRVERFSNSGSFISQWGSVGSGEGQFIGPLRIAADSNGLVYVDDNDNCRIGVFTSDGILVTQWGTPGTGTSQFLNPIGIGLDSFGNVYVCDTNASRIQEFGPVAAPTPTRSISWGSVKTRYR